MTQRSKRMHDERFVQGPFEETIRGGSKDYILVCVDNNDKAKMNRDRLVPQLNGYKEPILEHQFFKNM